jgi:hypothetical protein
MFLKSQHNPYSIESLHHANTEIKFQEVTHSLSSLESGMGIELEVVVKEKFRLACNVTMF